MGITLVEVALATVLLAFSLVTMARGFGTNYGAVQRAKDMNRAAVFLEETMDGLQSVPYANLAALDGNVFLDQATTSASRFRIDLSVTQVAVDLLEVRAVITDRRNEQVLTRVITYRSRR
jgi:hypothetical protein